MIAHIIGGFLLILAVFTGLILAGDILCKIFGEDD